MKRTNHLLSKNQKFSLLHFLLRLFIGSKYKNSNLELSLKIIAEIQILAMLLFFPFKVLQTNTSDSFAQFMNQLSGYLSFANVFSFHNPNTYIEILWCVLWGYICLLIALSLYILFHYHLKHPIHKYISITFDNLGLIHVNFAFLLIHQFNFSLLKSADLKQFTLFGSTASTAFIPFAILQLLINLFFAFIFCRYSYEPLRIKYSLATRSTMTEVLMLFFKIISPLFLTFIENSTAQKIIQILLMLIIFLPRVLISLRRIPYYYYNTMRMMLSFSYVELGLAISNLAVIIISSFEDIPNSSSVYFALIIAPFFLYQSQLTLVHKLRITCSKTTDNLKNSNQFYWKLFAVDRILRTVSSRSSSILKRDHNKLTEYWFYGLITKHQSKCRKPTCGCHLIIETKHTNQTLSHEKRSQYLANFQFELLKGLYKEGIAKFPTCPDLKIGLATLLFENKSRSYAPSINLIHALNLQGQSIEKKVTAIMLLELIETQMDRDNAGLVNVKNIVDYQSSSQQLRRAIESSIRKFLQFWENFKTPEPSLKKLYSLSVSLNHEADKIADLWRFILQAFSKLSYQDHLLYGLYQSLVRSAPYSAEKTLKRYFSFGANIDFDKNKESQVLPENVHESGNIVVCISMKKEKLGIVTFVTTNVEQFLQYNQSEVVDKDVILLMPAFFQERHKRFLLDHIENSRTSIFNRNRSVFTKTKKGYILPCTIYVTMLPYFQQQLSYIGILRHIKTFDEFILVLDDGTIDSFSENIGKALNLDPQFPRKHHLREISRELSSYHKTFLQYVPKPDANSKNTTRNSFSNFYGPSYNTMLTTKSVFKSGSILSQKLREKFGEEDRELRQASSSIASQNLFSLYESFTSTGVTISLHRKGTMKSESFDHETKYHEFNVIINEEHIYGVHLRVFRLQNTTTTNLDRMESEKVEDQSRLSPHSFYKQDILSSHRNTSQVDNSNVSHQVPMDMSVRVEVEEDIEFKNPFSAEIKTVQKKNTDNSVVSFPRGTSLHHQTNQDSYNLQSPESSKRKDESFYRKHYENSATLSVKKQLDFLKSTFYPSQKEKVDLVKSQDSPVSEKIEGKELRRFLQKNTLMVAEREDINEGGDNKSTGTSHVKDQKMNSKLENAIYWNEKDFSIRILTALLAFFCVASIGLLIACHLMERSGLDSISTNVEIIELAYNRTYYILELNRRARMANLLEEGLAPVARHTADYELTSLEALEEVAGNLSMWNNELRGKIYSIRVNSQNEFYQPMVIQTDDVVNNIRSVDSFQLCLELANAAFGIFYMLPQKPSSDDSNIHFILDNTLNDLLIKGNGVIDLVQEDNQDHLDWIRIIIYISLALISFLSLIILFFAFRIELKFKAARLHFLETFLMIKEHEIDHPISIVTRFHQTLAENKRENQFLDNLLEQQRSFVSKSSKEKKPQSKAFMAKKANFQGINNWMVSNLLILLGFLLGFALIFIILLAVFDSNTQKIDEIRYRIIDSKVTLFQFGLLFASLYEYVIENGGTQILNNPIGDEWETTYEVLARSESNLASFSSSDETLNNEVRNLLSGDLCSLLFEEQLQCYADNTGVASKGILAVSSFMMKSLRGVKDFYDNSDHSTQAIEDALVQNDLIDAENTYEIYLTKSYEYLGSLFMNQFSEQVDNSLDVSLLFTVVCSLGCLGLGFIVWIVVTRRMESERSNYRNILRVIPVSIYLKNRFLKNYLLTNSKTILESVKNKV